MAEIIIFVIEVHCQGLAVRLLFNEVELVAERNCSGKTTQLKLNPWIIEGTNKVEALLGKPENVETGGGSDAAPAFDVVVLRGKLGREPGEEGRVLEYHWDSDDAPLAVGRLASVWRQQFPVPQAFGRWAWQDANPSSLTAADEREIRALVEQFHYALSQRNAGMLSRLLVLKNSEMARALGIPPERLDPGQRSYFSSYFSEPDWSMLPLDWVSLDLRLQAGGRLVVVKGLDGKPPLRGVADERAFAFDLTLSKIGTQWRVVR